MKYPGIHRVEDIIRYADDNEALIDGKWLPARPLGFQSLSARLRCAWMVFTGRADALIWGDGQ